VEAACTIDCDWHGLDELGPAIRASLARRVPHEAEIDDIVQETLLRAARYRDGLDDPARLRPWVIRIAMNVMRDRVRRESRLPRVDDAEDVLDLLAGREEIPGDVPETVRVRLDGVSVEKDIVLHHIASAVAKMRGDDREVLSAYYVESRGVLLAARVCEVPLDLVKVRLYRARGRLTRMVRKRMALQPDLESLRRRTALAVRLWNSRSARCAPARVVERTGAPRAERAS
jgi:RNA polymerase sigma-70 factor (ECF subfamily)